MYSLLIAEDEDIIRNGLAAIINKMDLPLEVIACVSNGEQALVSARKSKPDIIITDIVMPKITGLDLISTLRSDGFSGEIIIISGYSDFNFARKAIAFNVNDYLLKPIQKTELKTALSKIIVSLEKSQMEGSQDEKKISEYINTINEYKKVWIKNILLSHYRDGSDVRYDCELDLNFNQYRIRAISIHFNCAKSNKNIELIHDYSRQLLQEIKKQYEAIYFFEIDWNFFVCILKTDGDESNKLNSFFSSMENHIRNSNFYNLSIHMGISDIAERPENVPSIIKHSEVSLYSQYFDNKRVVYLYESNFENNFAAFFQPKQYELIANAAMFSKTNLISDNINVLFNKISQDDSANPGILIFTIRKINMAIKSACEKVGNPVSLENELRNTLLASRSLPHLKTAIASLLIKKLEEYNNQEVKNQNYTIRYVLKYIEENYRSNIDLNTVSNLVFMNANYLSSLFKKTMGMGFVGYIQNFRIEKAKTLLMDPKMKIYEIAQLVGYNNNKYFCKLFKQLTGTTPVEYREKIFH